MSQTTSPRVLRRAFGTNLWQGLRVVWPILVALLTLIVALGSTVAVLEGWSIFEGIYFAFVSGLTIGYGDLAPKGMLGRMLAIAIGFLGIVVGGLVAAVAVQALDLTQKEHR